jgi:hypothetical protein
MKDYDVERLLRAGAQVTDDSPVEMPFGFDTRVVALWQSKANRVLPGLARLVRRVTLIATAVLVLAAAGAYFEINQNQDRFEPSTNEYAIADSAIQDEFGQ